MLIGLLQSCGGLHMPTSGLFSRNLKKTFPIAVRGEGCWIVDDSGRRYLDAAGQAAVVSIGHGVAEIGKAMAEQSAQIAFAHTSQFHTEPAERLAALGADGYRYVVWHKFSVDTGAQEQTVRSTFSDRAPIFEDDSITVYETRPY